MSKTIWEHFRVTAVGEDEHYWLVSFAGYTDVCRMAKSLPRPAIGDPMSIGYEQEPLVSGTHLVVGCLIGECRIF